MANPLPLAFPNTNWAVADVRRYVAEGFALVKLDASEVQTEDYSGTPYKAIIYNGSVYAYDAADTTTAHDGSTCLVSQDGRRYKIEPQTALRYKVDDKDTTAQPGSPAIGDAYLLPAAPTGDDWSSKAKNIAHYTARGWLFIAPEAGDIVYVADEGVYYHYSSGGTWTLGLADLGLTDDSVGTAKLVKKFGYIVEEETNTPPTLPGAGVAYIVGTSPTGAWSSNAGDIAESNGTGWVFFEPDAGSIVFDKGAGYSKKFVSGAWGRENATAGVLQTKLATLVTKSSGFSIAGVWDTIHTFSAITASSTSNRIAVRFSFDYKGQYSGSGARGDLSVGLFVDSEATARMEYVLKHGDFPTSPSAAAYDTPATGIFYLTPADLSAHDIHLKVKRSGNEYFTEVTGGLGIELMEVAQ